MKRFSEKQEQKHISGFSLVEMMIVVATAGILAGIAIPSFQRNLKQERLKAASQQTTAWLEDVRLRAMQQSKTCSIEISADNATLKPNTSSNTCDNISQLNLRDEVENAQSLVVCSQSELEPVSTDCSYNNTNTVPTEIVFTPRGTTSRGALIQLHIDPAISNRCIAITQPLGMIRQGIKASTACNYNTAY